MKKPHKTKNGWLLFASLFLATVCHAQQEKPSLMLNLSHYTKDNSLQFLKVQTQVRADNKIQPVKNVAVRLYLDDTLPDHIIGEIRTGEDGMSYCNIPAKLQTAWSSEPSHTFIAVASNPAYEEVSTELSIARAKMEIDTLSEDGTRTVIARVFSFEDSSWVPARDVDVRIGVKRLGGSLNIGDDESYTTDSLGEAQGEFKLDSLPATDQNGSLILVASVDDNDQFGSLSVEKTVPWGRYYKRENHFGERSLWAARFRAPLWLVFIAYGVIAGVWGAIIYLFVQIFRIKKLGREKQITQAETPVHEVMV